MIKYLVMICLLAVLNVVQADPPILVGGADELRVYKCYLAYDPPICVQTMGNPRQVPVAELLAASKIALAWKVSRVELSLGIVGGAVVDGCSNSHGQSGCCSIASTGEGATHIVCGQR